VAKTIEDLKAILFSAKYGDDVCDEINELGALAEKGSDHAKKVLALYINAGSVAHLRNHVCERLAEAVNEQEAKFVTLFRKSLSDPEIRYWSILGIINSAGKAAYAALTKIAEDPRIPLEDRAHAIKCLARYSKQKFDRNLSSDPGHWKESDLRLAELKGWRKARYPDGERYSAPIRHPALDQPVTFFEKIVSRLDKKLAKERQNKWQDLADPTDWLTPAAADDLERIMARWKLPSTYLDFLTRFSPLKVIIKARRFYNPFWLFGASELIGAQEGYSFNPIEQEPILDWPAHLVVIASHGGDPYVLDLSKSDDKDAPVDTAEHGVGLWEFRREADSFCEFLEKLAK
jgi:hypothetical protein